MKESDVKVDAGLDLMLFQAILNDDAISVQYLLDQGVDPSSWGNSGIYVATQHENVEMVSLLLGAKNTSNCIDGRYDDCLITAIKLQNRDIINLLISNGAWHEDALVCAVEQRDCETLSSLLVSAPRDEDALEGALLAATTTGLHEAVRLLLATTHVDPRVVLGGALKEARDSGFKMIVRQLEVACVCAELEGTVNNLPPVR